MKFAINKKFENFQLETFFSHNHFSEKIETVHLQSYLPYFDNNLFENNNKKAFTPTKPKENLSFLCL